MFVPPWCRWRAENPPKFTIWHNILFASAGGIFAANLYYSHPILEVMAHDFGTDQTGVANIPTLAQAGDGLGLVLILPLADFFPRRLFTLVLLGLTVAFWIGLCLTHSLVLFQAFTFLSAVFTGVHQIFIVLVAELADPANRAFNIAIVGSGPTLAILLARILSGIVANYIAWRYVYWISLGMQLVMLILLFLFMPDYPTTNRVTPVQLAKTHPNMLIDILMLFTKHPLLVQSGLLAYLTFFCVSSYWTTLTFLLSGTPYNYTTLSIGMFGLIGACTMVLGPVFGRYVIQPLGVPLYSALIGVTTSLVGIVLGTALGSRHVAGPVLQALLLDAGLMILFVAIRTSIHGLSPGKENRVNTAFVACLYLGMLSGTKAGNDVFARVGGTRGWIASGALSIGIMAFSYIVIMARGPFEVGWFGWTGGWGRKSTTLHNTMSKDTHSASGSDVERADEKNFEDVAEKQLGENSPVDVKASTQIYVPEKAQAD